MAKNDSVVRDSGLGGTIRTIRKASSYRDWESFAAQSGMSKEGLRKIENGDRLPNRETLARILEAGGVPEEQTAELHKLRDITQAKRDGLDLQSARDVNFPRLAKAAVKIFGDYLSDYDLELPPEDQQFLAGEVEKTLRARL